MQKDRKQLKFILNYGSIAMSERKVRQRCPDVRPTNVHDEEWSGSSEEIKSFLKWIKNCNLVVDKWLVSWLKNFLILQSLFTTLSRKTSVDTKNKCLGTSVFGQLSTTGRFVYQRCYRDWDVKVFNSQAGCFYAEENLVQRYEKCWGL